MEVSCHYCYVLCAILMLICLFIEIHLLRKVKKTKGFIKTNSIKYEKLFSVRNLTN